MSKPLCGEEKNFLLQTETLNRTRLSADGHLLQAPGRERVARRDREMERKKRREKETQKGYSKLKQQDLGRAMERQQYQIGGWEKEIQQHAGSAVKR